ncbi:hypothetical protein KAH94_05145 [bacterium]|nr:hypothetical protein [bacterium]
MKLSLKMVALIFVMGAIFQVKAQNDLVFINETLDEFFNHFVAKKDQNLFAQYYNKISVLLQEEKSGEALNKDLFKLGLVQLKFDHRNWFDAINFCIEQSKKQKNDNELKKVQIFLTRYGAYQDFLRIKEKLKQKNIVPNFFDNEFDDFSNRVVDNDYKGLFKAYYIRLSQDVSQGSKEKIKATNTYLLSKALESLENDKKDWFDAVSIFLSSVELQEDKENNIDLQQAQLFLRRYGAYQEFLEIKDVDVLQQESTSFIANVGSFFSNVGQTVAGWFGFGAAKSA